MSREHVNQHQLISEIANETEGLTRRQVAEVYEALLNKVAHYLGQGTEVEFTRFVKFELVDKDAKIARNPSNGEQVNVPAKTVVKVRSRKRLHELTKVK